MKTIVIVSRKGGAGKTTLAIHLGVEADRIGDGPVAIIDADPMGGASGWYNARKTEGGPQFVGVGSKGLKATLVALEDAGVELVIIDTPPAATEAIQSIIAESDLAIVPVIPSPNDLRAIGETLDLVEAAGRPVLFVLNNASAKAKLTGQASRLLSRDGPVAETVVASRQDYRSAMTDGRAASEVKPNSLAAKEVAALWVDVASRLKEGTRRRGTETRRT
jgi:chromosome partitioning protein